MENKKKKKGPLIVIIFVIVLGFLVYKFTGFFVIQPIGAIPEGKTVWYWRSGYNMDFFESADGILLKENGGVSLLGRAVLIGSIYEQIEDKIILELPYQKWMYLQSTDGVEFEK